MPSLRVPWPAPVPAPGATFDAPGGGTGGYQGTIGSDLNPEGAVAGYYTDANNANHGVLRTPGGAIITFNVPGAGTGSGQGTFGTTVDPAEIVIGTYIDASTVSHGLLRTP